MTRIAQVWFFSIAFFALFTGLTVEAALLPAEHPQVAISAPASTPEVSRIDVNSASLKDLRSLPGIGTVNARRILAGRPYASVDELQSRKIIPKATYEKIHDRIMVEEGKGAGGAGRVNMPNNGRP